MSCTPLPVLALALVLAGLLHHLSCATEGTVCGDRVGPAHGSARLILWRPSSVLVQYRCQPQYRLQGTRYGLCVRGQWASPLPSCVKKNTAATTNTEAGTVSGLVNDGVAVDQGVIVSMEELPSTERTTDGLRAKSRKIKRKKKRKRKGKSIAVNLMRRTGSDSFTFTNSTLDMTCLVDGSSDKPKFLRPPQVPNSLGPKFVRRKTGQCQYVLAMYRCRSGYKLHNPHSRSLGCQNRKWVGTLPICLARRKKSRCVSAGCEHGCKMVSGKPKCYCFKGFLQRGKSCKDINECSSERGGCQSTCYNTPGSFHCSCPPGYRLAADQTSCIDVNECLLRNGHGPCQGRCHNLVGGYQCSCQDTPGTRLAPDGISCADIDECRDTDPARRLACSHDCVNTVGSAFCLCPAGLQLGPDWTTCVDVTDCAGDSSNCSHRCLSDLESNNCLCTPGFALNPDNKTCRDIDECSEHPLSHSCSHKCQNTVGSYNCLCPPDQTLSEDKRTCRPKPDLCQAKNCTHDCVIQNDQAVCICDEGYELKAELFCVDIDECSQELTGCSHSCVNVDGSYLCSCPDGFFLMEDGKTCVEENNANIGENLEDFKYTNSSFLDVNECSSNNSCSQMCRNTEGSDECYCKDGFYLSDDLSTCLDINECEHDDVCYSEICINTEGSYYCKCPEGFRKDADSGVCEDIDECRVTVDENSTVCSHSCFNLPGTFLCECPSGFVLGKDSRTCVDIDECIENNEINSRCSHYCVNLEGSYRCDCPTGYALQDDNHVCSEVNGCDADNGGCSHICFIDGDEIICECPGGMFLSEDGVTCLVSCSNTEDSGRLCSCPEGYVLMDDKKDCVDLNECLQNNGNCSGGCLNTIGSYQCICHQGYQMDLVTQTCVDIDECVANSSICDQLCINTEGSFKCDCFNGFSWSNGLNSCEDINECLLDSKCDQICENTVGSFECKCSDGFSLSSDGQSCEDINECAINISACDQICENTVGSFECKCSDGFSLSSDGQSCEDINECAINISGCDQICENTVGSFECKCSDGFSLSSDGQSCEDINECATNISACDQICENTVGSFECKCSDGFSLSSDGQSCEDINECAINISGCYQICINEEGKFSCACSVGFMLVNETLCVEETSTVTFYNVCDQGYNNEHGQCCCGDGFVLFNNTLCVSYQTCKDFSGCDTNGTELNMCTTEESILSTNDLNNTKHGCRSLDFDLSTGTVECGSQSEQHPVGSECVVRCGPGYELVGSEKVTCLENGTWSEESVSCEARVRPYIRCPPAIRLSLPPGQNNMSVTLPRPTSNMDWDRFVTADPPWGKLSETVLPSGVTVIQYLASNPTSGHMAKCNLKIHIKDTEKPTISGCPSDLQLVLRPGETTVPVMWTEPTVSDNVHVAHVYQSQRPGVSFTPGSHVVNYIVADSSGNIAMCQFTVQIIDSSQPDQT